VISIKFSLATISIITVIALAYIGSVDAEKPKPYDGTQAYISFSFDHPFKSHYTAASYMWQNGKFSGTSYIVTQSVNKTGSLSWDQLSNLKKLGWDFASHTNTHPHMNHITEQALEDEVAGSEDIINSHGICTNGFVPPYGEVTPDSLAVAKRFYEYTMQFPQGINNITVFDADYNQYGIKIIHNIAVGSGKQLVTNYNQSKYYIDKAIEEKGWVVFNFHDIVINPASEYDVKAKLFMQIIDYAKTKVDTGKLTQVTQSQGLGLTC